ncbi:MAG: adenylate kinase [Spirochaetaceae bacterium]|nr:MAG: adenylate kinase [Spirochaetaceae bacterium]
MPHLPDHIHITGGSGSGTTTLGRVIAARYGHRHLDTDDFFWEQTDPPYTVMRPKRDVATLLDGALVSDPTHPDGSWVLSGAIGSWGYEFACRFDLVVWLTLPPEVRLARLEARERAEFGSRVDPGGDMEENFRGFIEWAALYDTADASLRSHARHAEWTATLSCPVIRVDGVYTVEETLAIIEERWHTAPAAQR